MTLERQVLPSLNRQVTIGFLGSEGVGPTVLVYRPGTFYGRPTFAPGEWLVYRFTGETSPLGNPVVESYVPDPMPVQASSMAHAQYMELSLTDANNQVLDPDAVSGGQVFVFGPGDAQIEFNIDEVRRFDDRIQLFVSGGILTGGDFVITTEGGLSMGYSQITSIRAGEASTMVVWCRIAERGSEAGLLAIQADDTALRIEESAEFVIRFIPPTDYSALTTVTDEFQRVWTVGSTRSILDRRYLALECHR